MAYAAYFSILLRQIGLPQQPEALRTSWCSNSSIGYLARHDYSLAVLLTGGACASFALSTITAADYLLERQHLRTVYISQSSVNKYAVERRDSDSMALASICAAMAGGALAANAYSLRRQARSQDSGARELIRSEPSEGDAKVDLSSSS